MSVHDRPPLKIVGTVFLLLIAALLTLVFLQFRGDLSPKTTLTMISGRSGLVMDSGSKVTRNGVVIVSPTPPATASRWHR
jgi:phospholipid/cholesterol/gamma-HCH transport system substrate-binding protein